ncbi:MAG: fibronectin type III domain-containing protein, partial [Thermoanaerobaculia bacterium]
MDPTPAPPSDLTVTNITGTSVTFTWNGPPFEFRAIYKAGSLPLSPTDGTLITEAFVNTATALGLVPGTRYFIAVYAKFPGIVSYSATAVSTSFITAPTALITSNGFGGAPWDRRGSPTRQGKFIFSTDTGDLNFFNGSAITTIQPKGAFLTNPNTVFVLGTAVSPAQVIAGWRRDDAYLSIDGGSPVMINATNPVNANHMDAEVIAIDSGYVFAVFRAPVGQSEVRNAFIVDPTTGNATNISNNTTVYGVTHISSSGNKAAWTFDDGTGSASMKLQYYNGSAASTIDTGIIGDPSISQGRIVYAKTVATGRNEIYLYDTNLASPSPVALTNDATKTNEKPFTDGRHAAWIGKNADGSGAEIMLNGLVQVTSGNFALLDNTVAPPFDLDRGQMLWRDTTGALHHLTSFSEEIVDPSAAANRAIPWLADGGAVFFDSTVSPSPIYLFTGRAPDDSGQPSPPMTLTATPGVGSVTLKWDAVLGATSYNVYHANVPGVTKANYASLT